ncbi:hypothetical protein [Rhodopseudomonas palustris]|uniref:hypothetical protein n=1 Tax=Rhodopseudomonas palustris TaxID=1076 RepID=UPI000D1B3666|nr:hypothetical protein [Rhodopseudomonas palustris]AVT83656.1 hypothetical protein RPYSC3_47960 [Rhodopseudomonas palustris]
MKEKLKNLWFALIRSSEDPKKLSMAVAGTGIALISFATPYLPLLCSVAQVCIDPSILGPFLDQIVGLIEGALWVIHYVGYVVGAAMALYGAIRKLINGRWTAYEPGV